MSRWGLRSPVEIEKEFLTFRSPIGRVSEETNLIAADDAGDSKVDLNEKATTVKKDIFAQYGVSTKAEGELDIADYREMMTREPQIRAAIMLKIFARLSTGYKIVPATEDAADVQIADFVRDQFNDMRGTFSGFLRRAMMAMAYGLSIHEIVLRVVEEGPWRGKIGLKALKWKHPENYRVKIDDFGNVLALEMKVDNEWEELPPEYFAVWAWNHEGDYKGRSDLRPAYRFFLGKDLVDRIWNIYLEKFSTPTAMSFHPGGATASAKDELTKALSNLHSTKAISVPQGWDVKLLEAMRAGNAGYEDKIKYCDRMMALAVLLPSLILSEGEAGAYALGKQHADNFTWVLDALGEELAEEIVEEQIIRPIVAYNFQTEQYPKFEWNDYSEKDKEKIANVMKLLIDARIVDPSEDWIREQLGIEPRDPGLNDPAPGGEPPTSEPQSGDPAGNPGGGGTSRTTGDESDGATLSVPTPRVVVLSKTASKFDYATVRARQDEAETRAVGTMADAVRFALSDLKAQMRRRKIVENRDYLGAEKLTIKGLGVFRAALEETLAGAVMFGASDGLSELRAGAKRTGNSMPEMPEVMGINLSWILPVEEPVEFATTRTQIVKAFEGKVPIQRAALAQYGREAYTITGVYRDELLSGSKRIIQKGIRRGASYAQIEAELGAYFQPYLEIDGAIDSGVANAYRLHNIVRTNMSEAYSTGRMNLFRDRAVGDFITAFEYSAILDDRTTDFCREWDGVILLRDSPEWGRVQPPNHYQCRGLIIPLTRGESFEVSNVPNAQPHEGFTFSCGCGSL